MDARSTGVSTRPCVVWFGLDLRLAENPALWAAGGRIAMVAEQVAGQASGGGGKTGLAADHPNAKAVFWNRRYEPAEVSRDQELKTVLRGDGLLVESFNGNPLFLADLPGEA